MKRNSEIQLFLFSLLILLSACGQSKQDHETLSQNALEQADYIMTNFEHPEISNAFPQAYFDRNESRTLINEIINNCNWADRSGGYRESHKLDEGDRMMYLVVYRYEMDCGELDFVFYFVTERSELLLYSFKGNPAN